MALFVGLDAELTARDAVPRLTAASRNSGSSSLLGRYDEPEFLPSSIHPCCLIGADAEHHLVTDYALACTTHAVRTCRVVKHFIPKGVAFSEY
jgi:hypothetical protein